MLTIAKVSEICNGRVGGVDVYPGYCAWAESRRSQLRFEALSILNPMN